MENEKKEVPAVQTLSDERLNAVVCGVDTLKKYDMNIEQVNQGSERILKLSGRLDTLTAPQLDAETEKLYGVTDLVLDFAGVAYISSAGLRVLLKAQKQMNAMHGTMKVIHVCPEVAEVFEVTGFDSILTVE